MSNYKNFKYSLSNKPNRWVVIFPSGFKTFIEAISEHDLKVKIDEIEANFKNI